MKYIWIVSAGWAGMIVGVFDTEAKAWAFAEGYDCGDGFMPSVMKHEVK